MTALAGLLTSCCHACSDAPWRQLSLDCLPDVVTHAQIHRDVTSHSAGCLPDVVAHAEMHSDVSSHSAGLSLANIWFGHLHDGEIVQRHRHPGPPLHTTNNNWQKRPKNRIAYPVIFTWKNVPMEQCCGSVSVLDPYSGASWIRIRNTDPDPHMQI